MKQPSQCERVLAVLADGQWHRMEEVHQRAGFMRLNSRISDLRARGHLIECDKRGHEYRYRLVGSLPPAEAPGRVSADGSDPQVTPLDRSGPRGAGHAEPHGCPAPPLFEPDELTRKPAWA